MTAKEDIAETARRRFAECADADRENRLQSQQDLRLLVGRDHWPEEIRLEREAAGKPCPVINAFPQFVRQVTGQIRQMNPAIRVVAADNAASKETAEIIEGLIRQIQYESDAQSVFEQSAESAASCGIGNFRLRSRYCHGETFDQELLIERIPNPFAVFWDPTAREPTRSDAQYCFIAEEMKAEEFKAAYPDAAPTPATDDHKDSSLSAWYTADAVTVAEYYWIEAEEVTIYLLADGSVSRLKPPAPVVVVRERKASIPRVKWAKVTGAEVLEGPTDVPGYNLPVFAVTGEEWHIGEEMYRSGVIRFAKDTMQLYNFARAAHIETIALQPKAPFLITAKQVAGFEDFWRSANTSSTAYLPYHPDPGAPGAPQRVQPPVSSQGIMTEMQVAAEDLKRTIGIYDASLGARSNETSGIAIQERQQEAQLATSVYSDNMVKAIRQCGRVMVQQIPSIYDTQRVVRILGEDGQEKLERINGKVTTLDGDVPVNDLTIGKYDVRIKVGPSYDTAREAASAGMMQFVQAVPASAAIIGDLVAQAQDWPDADRIAKRLRKAMPPGVIDLEDMEPEQQAQAQQAMQQAQAQQAQQAQIGQLQLQLAMAKAQAEVQKMTAETGKVGAETAETQVDTAQKQLELAVQSGQVNAAIEQAVARALMGVMAQFAPPTYGPRAPF